MDVTISTSDFDYFKYGGAILKTIKYTFDVDTQSELYRFMKTRLLEPNSKIIIVLE